MGDSRPDNGGGWPPEDGGRGLPDLPPEWGTIVVPDDASDLEAEAHAVRRQLRREARRKARGGPWWRKRFSFSIFDGSTGEPMAAPLVIMGAAVLITLIILFIVTWGRGASTSQQTPNGLPNQGTAAITTASIGTMALRDAAGNEVRLGTVLPAVVLLADGCDCTQLINEVAAQVPANVKVVVVDQAVRPLANRPANVIALADPGGTLRALYPAPVTAGTPTALVVNAKGDVLATVRSLTGAAGLPPLDPAKLF